MSRLSDETYKFVNYIRWSTVQGWRSDLAYWWPLRWLSGRDVAVAMSSRNVAPVAKVEKYGARSINRKNKNSPLSVIHLFLFFIVLPYKILFITIFPLIYTFRLTSNSRSTLSSSNYYVPVDVCKCVYLYVPVYW